LVPALERLVLAFSFENLLLSRDADLLKATWDLSDGLVSSLVFHCLAFDESEGVIQTSVFVISQDVADQEDAIEIWRCDPGRPGRGPPQRPLSPAALAGSSIEWLMWNESPSKGPVVWLARRGQEAELVQALQCGLQDQALPFLERLRTKAQVADFLLAFDDHPRRVPREGLTAIEREVRLPLLLISLGRFRDAERCITKFEQETEAGLVSGELTEGMVAYRRCGLSVVRRFLEVSQH
jgi:hypothetical protein